ncbi:Protein IDA-LIKE 3 [Cardamine amara subsp. amara]|uniref:Protein IDA-LIKE 3 n=1 Tax=Cardamine amara subsp. amara TaxID=228776 RepID=A0ABD1C4Z8_CARAN
MSSQSLRSRTYQLTKTIPIIVILLVLFSCCNGARTTNVFYTSSPPKQNEVVSPLHHHLQVQDHKNVQFLGFLPRQFPVPASGPSRKHNEIGLSSTRTQSSP